jgi:hypothetical protein
MAESDLLPTAGDWARLSLLLEKRDAFEKDLYFRECWADVAASCGARAAWIVGALAVLTFKPDAIVGRRLRSTLGFVRERGFFPAAMARIRFSRHSIRELWRYNWHFATIDRMALSTMLYTACDTLLLVLWDTRFTGVVPATVRLSSLKGSAAPEKRNHGHLREALRTPNRLLNFVHVADEPADVVRELGILLDRPARRKLLLGLEPPSDRSASVESAMDRLAARVPAHDLDLAASLRRLELSGAAGAPEIARVRKAVDEDRRLGWDELCALIDPADAKLDRWDFIVVGSSILRDERDGYEDLLRSVDPGDWTRAAAGRPHSRGRERQRE